MKRIGAIIRASHLERVREALHQSGIPGMTIYEARGVGIEQGPPIVYRGISSTTRYVARVKLEVLVLEEMAETVIDVIYQNAYSGEVGDGRILVSTLDAVIRIRTGECNPPYVAAGTR